MLIEDILPRLATLEVSLALANSEYSIGHDWKKSYQYSTPSETG